MRVQTLIASLALTALLAHMPALAGTGPTHCMVSVFIADNLTIKADVADGQLRIDKEGSFRVYLYNTMNWPYWDTKLDVLSDQFDAKVEPSPTWKTFPDLQPAAQGGTREYFTVTLTRKAGVPDGPYDVMFKVYSSRVTFRRLDELLPISEVVDRHVVPVRAGLVVDGKATPGKWADSLLIKDFVSYETESTGRYKALRSHAPHDQTRIHLAADKNNLYLLVLMAGNSQKDELEISAAPTIEGKVQTVKLDMGTGKARADSAAENIRCLKCEGDFQAGGGATMYEVCLPRKSLGLDGTTSFYANFCRVSHAAGNQANDDERSYWRGNDVSRNEPTVYGRMVLEPGK